jgi:hypothetical protein
MGGLIWYLRQKNYKVMGLLYLFVIALLMLGSGKGYYALGVYPMLLAGGAVWVEGASRRRRWLRYANVALILILALPFVPVLMPMQKPAAMAVFNQKYGLEDLGLLRWEDQQQHPLQQDFADMIGWKELAQKSERTFLQLPDHMKSSTIVYCRNYGQAGALRYYAKDPDFHSRIICDNGTFLLWIPDSLTFDHLLFVGRHMPEKDDEVFQHFSKVTLIDSVNNPLSRQHGDKIILFQQADTLASKLAREGLAEMKSVFGR